MMNSIGGTTSGFAGLVEFSPQFRPRPQISHVLFDFDGTLSLIRQGWPEVMVPMFVEMLPPQAGESDEQRAHLAFDDIMRLNGKQTIYQMIQLAERIRQRGGQPREPLWYKHEYLRRLDVRIRDRIEGLRSGRIQPDDLLLYGARPVLEDLVARGLTLYLASGTDEPFVKAEAELLDVARYFPGRVYGALDDYKSFSKQMVIDRILRENAIPRRSCWPSATATWRSRTPRASAAWRWPWPATRPTTAPAAWTPGSGSGCWAWAPTWSFPTSATGSSSLDRILATPQKGIIIERRTGVSWSRPPLDLSRVRVFPLAERRSLTVADEILVDPAAHAQAAGAAAGRRGR